MINTNEKQTVESTSESLVTDTQTQEETTDTQNETLPEKKSLKEY